MACGMAGEVGLAHRGARTVLRVTITVPNLRCRSWTALSPCTGNLDGRQLGVIARGTAIPNRMNAQTTYDNLAM